MTFKSHSKFNFDDILSKHLKFFSYLAYKTRKAGIRIIMKRKSLSIVKHENKPNKRIVIIFDVKLTKKTAAVVKDVTVIELIAFLNV